MPSNTNTSKFRPQRILLPIDFSPSSNAALETGKDMAQHYNAELILLTVIPMFSASKTRDEFMSTLSPGSVKRDDLDKLSGIVSELASQGIKATSKTEVGEDIVGNIMLTIKDEHIDMLIISTHGETGWRETVFGSIAQKLLEQAECPLLLLRSAKPVVKIDHFQDQALLQEQF